MRRFRIDCRHATGEKPCAPHKAEGVTCGHCPRFDPVLDIRLIIKLAAAGDVLRSTAILPALRRAFPRSALWWITDPVSKPLLVNHPALSWVLDTSFPLAGLLSSARLKSVYCLDMSREATAIAAMIPPKVPRKGFGLSPGGVVVPASPEAAVWHGMGLWDTEKKANRRSYAEHLFEIIGVPYAPDPPRLFLTDDERSAAAVFARENKLERFSGLLGLNVGSGRRWTSKRWSLEAFVALARLWKKKRPKTGVLLYGGPEEREVLSVLARRLKGIAISCGADNTLRAFAARLELCRVLVTSDTLALHIGVALKRNVVALFGPTSDVEIGLYGSGEKILPPEPCRCYYEPACRYSPSCVERIPVGEVAAAVERQWRKAGE